MSECFDILIIGGGPAGLTLGTALVASMPGLSVAIADRRSFDVPNDARSFALAAGVTRIYEALGIWDQMTQNAAPVEHMRITDSGEGDLSRPQFLRFDGDVVPGKPYAHMVPNRDLTRAVMAAAEDKVRYFGEEELTGVEIHRAGATAAFASGLNLSAKLIVAADGAMSKTRELVGIKSFVHDYAQSGLVTTISHEKHMTIRL